MISQELEQKLEIVVDMLNSIYPDSPVTTKEEVAELAISSYLDGTLDEIFTMELES